MPGSNQIPSPDQWSQNELGLLPINPVEEVSPDFSKTFAYMFSRDWIAKLWRTLRSDSDGNLKITPGMQSTNAPLITQFITTGARVLALPSNPLRKRFAIYNNMMTGTNGGSFCRISFGNSLASVDIFIPQGYAYIDDTWSGNVFLQGAVSGVSIVIEEDY